MYFYKINIIVLPVILSKGYIVSPPNLLFSLPLYWPPPPTEKKKKIKKWGGGGNKTGNLV